MLMILPLPDLTVLVSCVSLALSLVPCIGLLVLMIWVIWESFWNFLSCLSNGLDTSCFVERLHDRMYVLTALFQFLLCLFQKESK